MKNTVFSAKKAFLKSTWEIFAVQTQFAHLQKENTITYTINDQLAVSAMLYQPDIQG